ncbi:MAG: glycosyltransferase family 2 protein [Candidatus Coatesbacteria bacterium]|nr:glycosyltransferase family 2 protein [Candidatus Coatesbacteria bacterium]
MGSDRKQVSIIIPAFNEELNLEEAVLEVLDAAKDFLDDFEVLIINDGSRDRTGEIADGLAERFEHVRVIHHPFNVGYGGGQRTGLKYAQYPWVMIVPADRQFDPRDIEKYLPYIDEADVIVGYRSKRKDPLFRKMNTLLLQVVMAVLFGVTLRDVNWVKLMRKSILQRFTIESKNIGVDAEVIVKARHFGCRFREVHVQYLPRLAGQSKGDKLLNIAITLIELGWLFVFKFLKMGDFASRRLKPGEGEDCSR